MIILSLDTTGQDCSAALIKGEQVFASERAPIGHGHAEHLGPQVQKILENAGVTSKDLDRIAVCVGPGSFTGLRVALSFSRGLALPHNTPVLGISALQVWAAMADPEKALNVLAVHNARRSELFVQQYVKGEAVGAPRLLSPEAIAKLVKSCDRVCGSGAELLGHEPSPIVDPAVLAFLAQKLDPNDYPPEPLYQRPPDAKLPSKKRKKLV